MSTELIKIYLVDDHKIFVQGIANILSGEERIKVVGFSYDAASALEAIRNEQPDMIITDIRMAETTGIELTRIIKEEYPSIKVIGLSMFDNAEVIKELIDAGADGYLLKDLEKSELLHAIYEVYDGVVYYSGTISKLLLKAMENKDYLTKREKEIIKLIAKEKTNFQIAQELFISEHTVESHRKNIFRKTKVKSIVGLINYAHDNNLN
jgi:DNA-binding NarL/FixJ family response regulator